MLYMLETAETIWKKVVVEGKYEDKRRSCKLH